ncbi:type II secretion system protein GspL [Brevundimonas sp.]|uniref:type II secretion system protein GspL n=1 Tax=Brevundimonas sp. TaxID=1871086 RepID=UPI0035B3B507
MSATRLILLEDRDPPSADWLTFDAQGQVLARGRLTEGRPSQGAIRTVVVVQGTEVTVRWLTLAARSDAQDRAAAGWMLKDALAGSTDQSLIALGETDGDQRLVAVLAPEALARWLDHCRRLGVTPDVITPASLAILPPVDPGQALAVPIGDETVVRARRLAVAVEAELASVMGGDLALHEETRPEVIERLLIQAASAPPINLLPRAAAGYTGGWREWRLVAVLAGLLLLSPLMFLAADAWRHDRAAARTERETEALARRAWPDMAPGADPVAEAERRMAGDAALGGFSRVASALFAAIEQVEGAELDALFLDPDGTIRATLSHGDYGDPDRIGALLSEQRLTVTEASTLEEENGRIVSDLVIGATV